MKYHHWFSILGLIFVTNVQAYEPKIEIVEQFDDIKMIAFLDKKEISSNPEWNPQNGAPPLTVVDAITAVNKFIQTTVTPGAIQEIEIRKLPKHEKHWHYLIKVANARMRSKHSIYVVLMNGKVIPAIIEPQSYK